MDSLTQIVIGTSVGEYLGGKEFGNKAPLRGAILGTLPDLDVFIGPLLYSNGIQAEIFHRSITHSFLFGFLAAPLLGWGIAKITKKGSTHWKQRTSIAFWCLITHILIDLCTGYGTQLFWPFTSTHYAIDNIFVIDPLYTVPFLVFLIIALYYPHTHRKRRLFNTIGITISSIYLLWSFVAQYWAMNVFEKSREVLSLPQQTHMHTSAEFATTFLRRGWFEDETHRYLGRWGIFDDSNNVQRKKIKKHEQLLMPYLSSEDVQRVRKRRDTYIILPGTSKDEIALVPIQFGQLGGRDMSSKSFMMYYSIVKNENGFSVTPARNFNSSSGSDLFASRRNRIR